MSCVKGRTETGMSLEMVLNLGALFRINRSHFGIFSISDCSVDDLNGNDTFVDSLKVAKHQR